MDIETKLVEITSELQSCIIFSGAQIVYFLCGSQRQTQMVSTHQSKGERTVEENKRDNNNQLHVCQTWGLNYTVVCSFSVRRALAMSHSSSLSRVWMRNLVIISPSIFFSCSAIRMRYHPEKTPPTFSLTTLINQFVIVQVRAKFKFSILNAKREETKAMGE